MYFASSLICCKRGRQAVEMIGVGTISRRTLLRELRNLEGEGEV